MKNPNCEVFGILLGFTWFFSMFSFLFSTSSLTSRECIMSYGYEMANPITVVPKNGIDS